MAKGKNAAKKNKSNGAGLPAGFTPIDVGGGFGAWHDFNVQKSLVGTITGMDSMITEDDKGNKKKRRILRIKKSDGVTVSVGESHALIGLFDDFKKVKGHDIFIRLDGQKKFKNKKGQSRKVNQFTVAVK